MGKWRPLPLLISQNCFTTDAAESDEKLNRMLESGVSGQCERTTHSWTRMFRSVRKRHAYRFVRIRQKLEEGASGPIPAVKGGRIRSYVSCDRNIIQYITIATAKCERASVVPA